MNPATLRALANQLNNPDHTSISVLRGQIILRIKTAKYKDLHELSTISLIKNEPDKLFSVSVVKNKKLDSLLLSRHVKNIPMNAVSLNLTYITCEIKDGEPVAYKDIYGLDNGLKRALYRAAAKKD